MVHYTDKTLMPFGEHKGVALANVPARYLLWCLREISNLSPPLKAYIEENKVGLEKKAKRVQRFNNR